jgi:hypothetical protein
LRIYPAPAQPCPFSLHPAGDDQDGKESPLPHLRVIETLPSGNEDSEPPS